MQLFSHGVCHRLASKLLERCYTVQCFLQLVSQRPPKGTRENLSTNRCETSFTNHCKGCYIEQCSQKSSQRCRNCSTFQRFPTILLFSLLQSFRQRNLRARNFRATCVATKLRDKLYETMPSVTPPIGLALFSV